MTDKEPWVQFRHYRYAKHLEGELLRYMRGVTSWTPTEKGGLTICTIKPPDGQVYYGQAMCSKQDAFSYKLGRMISRGRAEKKMELARLWRKHD